MDHALAVIDGVRRTTAAFSWWALAIAASATACANNDGAPLYVQTAAVESAVLEPAPINPDWIVSGQPRARAKNLTLAADQNFSSTVWDCTAGSFRWHFGSDEIVHVLEGEVVVEMGDGSTRLLKVGDVALFPKGLVSTWTVNSYVKKLAVHRTPPNSIPRQLINSVVALF